MTSIYLFRRLAAAAFRVFDVDGFLGKLCYLAASLSLLLAFRAAGVLVVGERLAGRALSLAFAAEILAKQSSVLLGFACAGQAGVGRRSKRLADLKGEIAIAISSIYRERSIYCK